MAKKKVRRPAGKGSARALGKVRGRPKAVRILAGDGGEEVLAALAERLKFLAPALRRYAVEKPGGEDKKNFYLLDLARVLYLTTDRKERGAYAVAFVVEGGERYFSAKPLSQIAEELAAGNPRFMQTHQSYVVNLAHVTRWRYARARDLWFTGLAEPLANAVSDTYRDAFDARVVGA